MLMVMIDRAVAACRACASLEIVDLYQRRRAAR
jgi:hypothetical protein